MKHLFEKRLSMFETLWRIVDVFILTLLIFILVCCDPNKPTKNESAMQLKIDSLNHELESNQKITKSLVEIGNLMDSIDVSRELLRLNFEGEEPIDGYVERMRDLNRYVRATNNKIKELEQNVKNSNNQTFEFISLIKSLKNEVSTKTREISDLKNKLEDSQLRNTQLESVTEQQGIEISKKDELITQKENEIVLRQSKIQEVESEARKAQADAYFKAGEALELAAQRTQLAPRKKKETLREALGLFEKAMQLGKEAARGKIEKIEKQL